MYQAASDTADTRALQRTVQNGKLLEAERSRNEAVMLGGKAGWLL